MSTHLMMPAGTRLKWHSDGTLYIPVGKEESNVSYRVKDGNRSRSNSKSNSSNSGSSRSNCSSSRRNCSSSSSSVSIYLKEGMLPQRSPRTSSSVLYYSHYACVEPAVGLRNNHAPLSGCVVCRVNWPLRQMLIITVVTGILVAVRKRRGWVG